MAMMVDADLRFLFLFLTGAEFPDTDEDLLRALADAWEVAGDRLECWVEPELRRAVAVIRSSFAGAAEKAFTALMDPFVDGSADYIDSSAQFFREIADVLRQFALDSEYMKYVVVSQLAMLKAEMEWAAATAFILGPTVTTWLAFRFAWVREFLDDRMLWLNTRLPLLGQMLGKGRGFMIAMTMSMNNQFGVTLVAQGIQVLRGNRHEWTKEYIDQAAITGAVGGFMAPFSSLGGHWAEKFVVKKLDKKYALAERGYRWHLSFVHALTHVLHEGFHEFWKAEIANAIITHDFLRHWADFTAGASSGVARVSGRVMGRFLRRVAKAAALAAVLDAGRRMARRQGPGHVALGDPRVSPPAATRGPSGGNGPKDDGGGSYVEVPIPRAYDERGGVPWPDNGNRTGQTAGLAATGLNSRMSRRQGAPHGPPGVTGDITYREIPAGDPTYGYSPEASSPDRSDPASGASRIESGLDPSSIGSRPRGWVQKPGSIAGSVRTTATAPEMTPASRHTEYAPHPFPDPAEPVGTAAASRHPESTAGPVQSALRARPADERGDTGSRLDIDALAKEASEPAKRLLRDPNRLMATDDHIANTHDVNKLRESGDYDKVRAIVVTTREGSGPDRAEALSRRLADWLGTVLPPRLGGGMPGDNFFWMHSNVAEANSSYGGRSWSPQFWKLAKQIRAGKVFMALNFHAQRHRATLPEGADPGAVFGSHAPERIGRGPDAVRNLGRRIQKTAGADATAFIFILKNGRPGTVLHIVPDRNTGKPAVKNFNGTEDVDEIEDDAEVHALGFTAMGRSIVADSVSARWASAGYDSHLTTANEYVSTLSPEQLLSHARTAATMMWAALDVRSLPRYERTMLIRMISHDLRPVDAEAVGSGWSGGDIARARRHVEEVAKMLKLEWGPEDRDESAPWSGGRIARRALRNPEFDVYAVGDPDVKAVGETIEELFAEGALTSMMLADPLQRVLVDELKEKTEERDRPTRVAAMRTLATDIAIDMGLARPEWAARYVREESAKVRTTNQALEMVAPTVDRELLVGRLRNLTLSHPVLRLAASRWPEGQDESTRYVRRLGNLLGVRRGPADRSDSPLWTLKRIREASQEALPEFDQIQQTDPDSAAVASTRSANLTLLYHDPLALDEYGPRLKHGVAGAIRRDLLPDPAAANAAATAGTTAWEIARDLGTAWTRPRFAELLVLARRADGLSAAPSVVAAAVRRNVVADGLAGQGYTVDDMVAVVAYVMARIGRSDPEMAHILSLGIAKALGVERQPDPASEAASTATPPTSSSAREDTPAPGTAGFAREDTPAPGTTDFAREDTPAPRSATPEHTTTGKPEHGPPELPSTPRWQPDLIKRAAGSADTVSQATVGNLDEFRKSIWQAYLRRHHPGRLSEQTLVLIGSEITRHADHSAKLLHAWLISEQIQHDLDTGWSPPLFALALERARRPEVKPDTVSASQWAAAADARAADAAARRRRASEAVDLFFDFGEPAQALPADRDDLISVVAAVSKELGGGHEAAIAEGMAYGLGRAVTPVEHLARLARRVPQEIRDDVRRRRSAELLLTQLYRPSRDLTLRANLRLVVAAHVNHDQAGTARHVLITHAIRLHRLKWNQNRLQDEGHLAWFSVEKIPESAALTLLKQVTNKIVVTFFDENRLESHDAATGAARNVPPARWINSIIQSAILNTRGDTDARVAAGIRVAVDIAADLDLGWDIEALTRYAASESSLAATRIFHDADALSRHQLTIEHVAGWVEHHTKTTGNLLGREHLADGIARYLDSLRSNAPAPTHEWPAAVVGSSEKSTDSDESTESDESTDSGKSTVKSSGVRKMRRVTQVAHHDTQGALDWHGRSRQAARALDSRIAVGQWPLQISVEQGNLRMNSTRLRAKAALAGLQPQFEYVGRGQDGLDTVVAGLHRDDLKVFASATVVGRTIGAPKAIQMLALQVRLRDGKLSIGTGGGSDLTTDEHKLLDVYDFAPIKEKLLNGQDLRPIKEKLLRGDELTPEEGALLDRHGLTAIKEKVLNGNVAEDLLGIAASGNIALTPDEKSLLGRLGLLSASEKLQATAILLPIAEKISEDEELTSSDEATLASYGLTDVDENLTRDEVERLIPDFTPAEEALMESQRLTLDETTRLDGFGLTYDEGQALARFAPMFRLESLKFLDNMGVLKDKLRNGDALNTDEKRILAAFGLSLLTEKKLGLDLSALGLATNGSLLFGRIDPMKTDTPPHDPGPREGDLARESSSTPSQSSSRRRSRSRDGSPRGRSAQRVRSPDSVRAAESAEQLSAPQPPSAQPVVAALASRSDAAGMSVAGAWEIFRMVDQVAAAAVYLEGRMGTEADLLNQATVVVSVSVDKARLGTSFVWPLTQVVAHKIGWANGGIEAGLEFARNFAEEAGIAVGDVTSGLGPWTRPQGEVVAILAEELAEELEPQVLGEARREVKFIVLSAHNPERLIAAGLQELANDVATYVWVVSPGGRTEKREAVWHALAELAQATATDWNPGDLEAAIGPVLAAAETTAASSHSQIEPYRAALAAWGYQFDHVVTAIEGMRGDHDTLEIGLILTGMTRRLPWSEFSLHARAVEVGRIISSWVPSANEAGPDEHQGHQARAEALGRTDELRRRADGIIMRTHTWHTVVTRALAHSLRQVIIYALHRDPTPEGRHALRLSREIAKDLGTGLDEARQRSAWGKRTLSIRSPLSADFPVPSSPRAGPSRATGKRLRVDDAGPSAEEPAAAQRASDSDGPDLDEPGPPGNPMIMVGTLPKSNADLADELAGMARRRESVRGPADSMSNRLVDAVSMVRGEYRPSPETSRSANRLVRRAIQEIKASRNIDLVLDGETGWATHRILAHTVDSQLRANNQADAEKHAAGVAYNIMDGLADEQSGRVSRIPAGFADLSRTADGSGRVDPALAAAAAAHLALHGLPFLPSTVNPERPGPAEEVVNRAPEEVGVDGEGLAVVAESLEEPGSDAVVLARAEGAETRVLNMTRDGDQVSIANVLAGTVKVVSSAGVRAAGAGLGRVYATLFDSSRRRIPVRPASLTSETSSVNGDNWSEVTFVGEVEGAYQKAARVQVDRHRELKEDLVRYWEVRVREAGRLRQTFYGMLWIREPGPAPESEPALLAELSAVSGRDIIALTFGPSTQDRPRLWLFPPSGRPLPLRIEDLPLTAQATFAELAGTHHS